MKSGACSELGVVMSAITMSLLVAFITIPANALAGNATAASCSEGDVQAAVNQVLSGGGGTVFIPAGTCTWTSTAVTVSTGSSKDIKIIGAGQHLTIINDFYLKVDGSGSNITELSNMTIGAVSRNGEIFNGKFRPANNPGSKELNFHHLIISGRGPIGTIEGWNGVVHDSYFTCRSGQYGWYVHGYGNYDVAEPPMGTRNSLFFENNTFDGCYHSVSGFCNSKIVFRQNTIKNSTHCVDVHGPSYDGCYYSNPQWGNDGGRLFEHYNNTYLASAVCGAKLRSGSGVSFGNTYQFTSDGWWSYFGIAIDAGGASGGCADGTHKYTYPCTNGVCEGPQKFWVWNETCPSNAWGGSEVGIGCFNISNNECPGALQQNREFFLRAPDTAGDGFTYTPYTYPYPVAASSGVKIPRPPRILGIGTP